MYAGRERDIRVSVLYCTPCRLGFVFLDIISVSDIGSDFRK